MNNYIRTIEDASEEWRKVLVKQFSIVGAEDKLPNIQFDDITIPWYTLYTWSPAQEDEFSTWLEDELYNNPKLRREIMQFPKKNKKYIKKVVEQYLLMWDFKLEKEE